MNPLSPFRFITSLLGFVTAAYIWWRFRPNPRFDGKNKVAIIVGVTALVSATLYAAIASPTIYSGMAIHLGLWPIFVALIRMVANGEFNLKGGDP